MPVAFRAELDLRNPNFSISRGRRPTRQSDRAGSDSCAIWAFRAGSTPSSSKSMSKMAKKEGGSYVGRPLCCSLRVMRSSAQYWPADGG